MNLRILKKLSKRAAAYLPLIGDDREQFRSEKGDNYHGLVIKTRKHWERTRIHPSRAEEIGDDFFIYTSRAGHKIYVRQPSHPLKGTIMVGSVSGYYEPEWDEETAWGAVRGLVADHFTDWDAVARDDDSVPWLTRRLDSVGEIFAAADEMVREGSR